ncbi:MAG TPA: cytochrome c oxidase subunit II [Candidatus Dormibacteraeota bacterium]|nr:cytochrome c oxidase subunit II [Candidatus Dormibacteraeota bacterium]
MLSRPAESGSTSTALALSVFLVLMTAVTVYILMAKIWWFPPAITAVGHEIDGQFALTFLITGVIFVLAQIALAYTLFRFRDRGQKVTYFEGNNTMEVVWTLVTLVLFVGLGLYAQNAWAQVHFMGAAPGALPIEVTAEQFAWNFRYAGPDGKFGRESSDLVSASTGNPVGLDPNDPASKDDVVVPVMAVPVNRQVELIIRSEDVTHSFFVRELRLKQDAVPGMDIHMHFTATVPGVYEIACAELCGLGHYRMHSTLTVMSQADFNEWMKQQEAANQ